MTSRRISMGLLVLASIASLVALANDVASAADWAQAFPSQSPPARAGHSMAFDSARGVIVLFGGQYTLDDTWEWNGTNWNPRSVGLTPPARTWHAMAYDEFRRRVVLFGGRSSGGTALQDTWEWDGTSWANPSPAVKPPVRQGHRMAYDAVRRRVVLFGGQPNDGSPSRHADTWEWDGTNWVDRTPPGSPPGRSFHGLAANPILGRIILFGGYVSGALLNDTWEWDGSAWTQKTLDGQVGSPARRSSHSLAFDGNSFLLFGGQDGTTFRNDTWVWGGTAWTQICANCPPPNRSNHALAYDSWRARTVMFGGESPAPKQDTWEYRSASPVGMAFVPAGTFRMGDSFGEGEADELPVHDVYLSSYYIDKFEVTNQQYAAALNWAFAQGGLIAMTNGVVYQAGSGTNFPYCDTMSSSSASRIIWNTGTNTFSVISGKENHSMVRVSWYGAAAYCNWRSSMEGRQPCYDHSTWACNFGANGYRLPTEAEWEKAARGGTPGHRFPWSDTDTIQHARANYYSSSTQTYDTSPTAAYHPLWGIGTPPFTIPVGFFTGALQTQADWGWPGAPANYQTVNGANGYGLSDMAGSVWEWCNDWYLSNYYSGLPASNPTGPTAGTYRVVRGGAWNNNSFICRCASRNNSTTSAGPDVRYDHGGFRCAASTAFAGGGEFMSLTCTPTTQPVSTPFLLKAVLRAPNGQPIDGAAITFTYRDSQGVDHVINEDGVTTTNLTTSPQGESSVYFVPPDSLVGNPPQQTTIKVYATFPGNGTYPAATSPFVNLTLETPRYQGQGNETVYSRVQNPRSSNVVIFVHGDSSDASDLVASYCRWQRMLDPPMIWLLPSSVRNSFDYHVWRHKTARPIGFNGTGNAKDLADYMASLGYASGTKYVLVAHSRGSLVARAFMKNYPQYNVVRLITLGGVHHGSPLAVPDWSAAIWESFPFLGPGLFDALMGPGEGSLLRRFQTDRIGSLNYAWDNADGAIPIPGFTRELDVSFANEFGFIELSRGDANVTPSISDSTVLYSANYKLAFGTLADLADSADMNRLVAIGAFDGNTLEFLQPSVWPYMIASAVLSPLNHGGLSVLRAILAQASIDGIAAGRSFNANDGMVPLQSALNLDISGGGAFTQTNSGGIVPNYSAIANARIAKRIHAFWPPPGGVLLKHAVWDQTTGAGADVNTVSSGLGLATVSDHLHLLDTPSVYYWKVVWDEIACATNSPPVWSPIPEVWLCQNASFPNAVHLRAFVDDDRTADNRLKFEIVSAASTCGVSIDSGGKVDISPTLGWSGECIVTIKAIDECADSSTTNFTVRVVDLATCHGTSSFINPPNQPVGGSSPPTALRSPEVVSFEVHIGGGQMTPWTAAVTSGSDWLSIQSGTSGAGSGTIVAAYDTNPTTTQRIGTIRVTAAGEVGSPWDVTVTQAGATLTSVQMVLAPDEAATAGVQWRINGGPWQPSGATVSDLLPGSYTLEYQTAGAWIPPPTESVELSNPVESLARTFGSDCNNNGIRDDEDVAAGTAPDCNRNNIPDSCDISSTASLDANGNNIPDECDLRGDLNGDGSVNAGDAAAFLAAVLLTPDAPANMSLADMNGDGVVNGGDIQHFVLGSN